MRTIGTRHFIATIAIAAVIGAVAGIWSSGPSTAATPASSGAGPSQYCSNMVCESVIWLRAPLMRRAGGGR